MKSEDIRRRLSGARTSKNRQKARRNNWSWRDAPEESLSDWKLIVKATAASSNEEKIYHVHKSALSFGDSGYFKRLFLTEMNVQERQTSTSTFEFEPLACQAFPMMLDYLYHSFFGKDDFNIEGKYVVALRFLAGYFDIEKLQDDVVDCMVEYMDVKNCATILNESYVFQDELLSEVAADFCAENLDSIDESVILSLSPPLFEILVKSEKVSDSKLCSTLCSKYIEVKNLRQTEYFMSMTNCNHLSDLSLEASLRFMRLLGNSVNNSKSANLCTLDIKTCSAKSIEVRAKAANHKPVSLKLKTTPVSAKQAEDDEDTSTIECNIDCLFSRCSTCVSENVLDFKSTDVEKYLEKLTAAHTRHILMSSLDGYKSSYKNLEAKHKNLQRLLNESSAELEISETNLKTALENINDVLKNIDAVRVSGARYDCVNGTYYATKEPGFEYCYKKVNSRKDPQDMWIVKRHNDCDWDIKTFNYILDTAEQDFNFYSSTGNYYNTPLTEVRWDSSDNIVIQYFG